MATVREIKALFTAQTKGIMDAFKDIKKETAKLGPAVKTSTDEADKHYKNLEKSAEELQAALKELGDIEAFKRLNDSAEAAQQEIAETGQVSEDTMRALSSAVDESASHFDSMSAEAQANFSDVTAAIDSVQSDLTTLSTASANSLNGLSGASAGAQSDLNNVSGAANDLDSDLQSLGDANSLDNLSGDASNAQSDLNELGGAADLVDQDLSTLGSQNDLSNVNSDASSAESSINELADAANQADSQLEDLGGDTGLDEVAADADDASDSLGSLGGPSGVVTAAGAAFVGAATGILGFLAAGAGIFGFIKSADELQQAVNNLQVQTGATTDEIDEMRDSLVDVYGANYGEGFQDIADSMAIVKNTTKQTGDELEDTTKKALLLRDSFDLEVGETMKVVSVLMKQFGIDSDEAMTMLAEGAQNGMNFADDMADSFWEYSGYFETLGYTAEEMWTTFKEGADAGAFNLDKVGDAVKEFGIRLIDGSESTGDALSFLYRSKDFDDFMASLREGGTKTEAFMKLAGKVGKENAALLIEDMGKGGKAAEDAYSTIEYTMGESGKLMQDMANGTKTGKDAMDEILGKIGEIEDVQTQTEIGVALFGTQWEDLGAETMLQLGSVRSEIDLTNDTLKTIDGIKYNSIGEAITGIGRKLVSNVLIPVQDIVMPGINAAVNATAGVLGALSDKFGAFLSGEASGEDLLTGFGLDPERFQGITNALNLIPHALSKIKDGFSNVSTIIQAVFALFSNNDGTAIELLHAIGMSPDQIRTVMDRVDSVKEKFGEMMGYLEGAVNTAQDIWSNGGAGILDTIKQIFIDIWPSVKSILGSVVSFIGESIGKIVQFWSENGEQILSAVSNVFKGIKAVIDFIMPAVLFIIDMVWTNIKGVINGALNAIMGLVKIFTGLFTGDFSKMWEGVKQLFVGVIEFLWNFIQLTFYGKILSGAKAFILSFRSFFDDLWRGIVALFKGGGSSAMTTISTAWQSILRLTREAFSAVGTFLKNTWDSIKSIASGATSFVRTTISKAWDLVKSNTTTRFSEIFNTIRTMFGNIRTNVSDAASFVLTKIKNAWTSAKNSTSEMFRDIFNAVKNAFNNIRNTVTDSTGSVFSKIRDVWSSIKTNTSNAFRDIFNTIKSRFDNIVNAAKALPQRIGDGIGGMASKVTSGVTKVINKLAQTLGKGVNGVIGGINWVLGKIGSDTEIKKWTVPQWAHGTGDHPGGLMVVGDGKGSNAGPELIETPDGQQMLSPSKPTLTTAPKGTKVWSATETRKIMDMIPQYAWGDVKDGVRAAGDWVADKWANGKEKVKSVGTKVKDAALNVFDYIKNPSGLMNAALKALGVETPTGSGMVNSMAKGAFNKAKTAAVDFVKDKLKIFGETQSGIALTGGNGGGFGAPFRLTSKPGPRNTGIPGASTYHKGWDWAAPIGTPIPSVSDGVVSRTGYNSISGNFVEVRSGNRTHRYQHNSRNAVGTGQSVKKGQVVAYVGNTGVTSGPHLHYELKGYEDGGIVDTKQLAWIAEGGWAESIISHDPAKRTSQRAIWEQTGKELGFDQATMRSMPVPSGDLISQVVLPDGRVLAEFVQPWIDILQGTKNSGSSFMRG